jgi:ABC-type transport system involved in multi-copper enzyme maturation permease subunit
MNMSATSFLSLVLGETRRMIKGSITSYFWFIILVSISTYSLFFEKYVDMSIDHSLMTLKTTNNPMADVLSFVTSFAINSAQDILSGKAPALVFPVSVGVIFFILFPMLLALTMMSHFIINRSSTSIAGENEKKTLFILAISPLKRSSIYIGKFIGIFLLALPMILFLYIITQWVFSSLFSAAPDLSVLVLETSVLITFLFISFGMLISVLNKNEKTASWLGTKTVGFTALLTTFWILIPFIEFLLNLTNNNSGVILLLEKINWLSPFTLGLMYVYVPSVNAGNFSLLIVASVIFFFAGMVAFIRKDIEI